MTDYTPIPNTAVQLDAPITEEVMRALRDNPIAIAEGAPIAPRVAPRAFVGTIFGGNGSGTSVSSVVDLDPLCMVDFSASCNWLLSSYALQISASNNNGTGWGGWVNILTAGGNYRTASILNGMINLTTGLGRTVGLRSGNVEASGGGGINQTVDAAIDNVNSLNLGVTNINALRFRASAANMQYAYMLRMTGRASA